MRIKKTQNLDTPADLLNEDLLDNALTTVLDTLEKPDEESDQVIENAYSEILRNLIQEQLTVISNVESAIATFLTKQDLSDDKIDSIKAVLEEISDNSYLHIGMLQKAIAQISDKIDSNIDAGQEAAEQIISEE